MISKRNGAEILLNAQYIKDLSFENPKAPEIYTYKDTKPQMEVSIDLNATRLQNDIFEVATVFNIKAKDNDNTMFVIELVYAGIFIIKNADDNTVQENLFIDCPVLIFPFARRVIANIVQDANFPTLMLDVIDFENLYNQKKDSIANK